MTPVLLLVQLVVAVEDVMKNPSLLFLSILVLNQACGSKLSQHEVKDYKFDLQVEDEKLREEIVSLMDQFNARACAPILSIADNGASNSTIKITDGLEARDGKVGWGRWTKRSVQSDADLFEKGEVKSFYGMDLEFDKGYFNRRIASDNEELRKDLFKLMSHEVGHGLEMGHSSNPDHLMYPDISGQKDLRAFFVNVRAYISGAETPRYPQGSKCEI